MIIERLTLGRLQTNCYVLADEDSGECAVFDPAADAERILDTVRHHGLKVKYIILTHVHIDHILALDELKAATGAEIAVHEAEAALLNDRTGTLAELFGEEPPCSAADIVLTEKDELFLGARRLKFIHTPGHTPGGMCVLCENILIAGDTLFSGSVGRTDFPNGSHAQLIEAINQKLMTLPDSTRVYSGHGPSTTIGNERDTNPYL